MVVMEIFDVFEYAQNIYVYNQGNKCEYASGSDGYKKIMESWNEMLDGAHPMPAFGVSINNLTLKEMQSGVWVEFEFGKEHIVYGMPFERLLINVNETYCGFNIVRYTSEYGYDGRCYYLDLVNKNMSNFYADLMDL